MPRFALIALPCLALTVLALCFLPDRPNRALASDASQDKETGKSAAGEEGKKKKKKKKGKGNKRLERTRDQVRMLDDLYKTAIVLITDKYVEDKDSYPAGGLATKLFGAMQEKGWHDVRLLDATGDPIRKKNAASDDFEKAALAELKAGKGWYEKVVKSEGKRYLRVATPVPVVSKKCIYCHEHYADAKEGEPIGAIGYRLEIK